MNLRFFRPILVVYFLAVLAGCGEDTGRIQFATTTGVVTYEGSPLSGAQVMAHPEKGPVAIGNTDASGRFKLFSGVRSGVAIGKIRVTVSLADSESNSIETPSSGSDDPADVARASQSMIKIVEAQKAQRKKPKTQSSSVFAKKYGDVASSGLNYEINSGSNNLKIDLK